MKVMQPDSMEGQQSLSRSNAMDHNYLLGGKEVSLVVTVSVITEDRKLLLLLRRSYCMLI